jgi:hypothetical protein
MPNWIQDLLDNQNRAPKQQNNIPSMQIPQNPEQLAMEMLKRNPNYQTVMSYIQQSGGTYKSAFYKMCQERGIDPNQILGRLQQNKM